MAGFRHPEREKANEAPMRLNQVTVSLPDLDAGWRFYGGLGLIPIVDSRPDYVRFVCPDGDATFSLHRGDDGGGGTTVYFECDDLEERVAALKAAGYVFTSPPTDQRWLWREAELFDPGGNRILLYLARQNRLNPPWRLPGGDR
jgi:catechol 2,3-dioxygenase-like lactoylglutathione lyase family enzyme